MNEVTFPITSKKLGVIYTPAQTTVNVWAPTVNDVKLALYDHPKVLQRTLYKMLKDTDGVYSITLEGDYHGYYYTFIIDDRDEITDPYAVSTSANGARGAIVDLQKTNPEGWSDDLPMPPMPHTEAILYELHIKDYTADPTAKSSFPGKYLGLCEEDTAYEGYATGLDHLVDLGITHVHLMPVFDFISVDELSEDLNAYNWGYDPEHYNTPEGSYALDPQDPISRIIELKTLIQTLHQKGMRVVMDVVYNHTYRSKHASFNVLAPGYYYRMTKDGKFSNGSGCGNELATENPMVQKFILESLRYWVEEYHIDGFRFDLMALIDMDTLVLIQKTLSDIKPGILIYGEPWMGGLSTLADSKRLFRGAQCNKGFALFNDEFRDAIKGDNDGYGYGFLQGNLDLKHRTQIGLLGSIPYDANFVGFTTTPSETINYINSHDNLILYDKLQKTNPTGSEDDLIRLNKLAFNLLFMAQGVPFLHEGNECLRSKNGNHNSYNADLSVNAIHWDEKMAHYAFYLYVRDLIAFRKKMKCFSLHTAEDIRRRVKIYEHTEHIGHQTNVIAMSILGEETDDYKCLFIVHNAQPSEFMLSISEIMGQLCASYQQKIPLEFLKIELIFDESGMRYEPHQIEHQTHHLIKVPRFSSAIYKFSPLSQGDILLNI
ncbi:MAG: pullulanase [Clostridiales bacterium]|jgi:pullulanase|nr:pullulanase [Clostridiales bacterium]MDN5298602.1 pullulanase [Clostridiales bacterium]